MNTTRNLSTQKLVAGAMLTALVILLQYVCRFLRFGPFSITLVQIPIIIGAATCGAGIASWLGLVFGFAVIIFGDAAPFFAVNVPGTIITVLSKGVLCGLAASVTYNGVKKLLAKTKASNYIAVMVSAVVCPLVNTGVFLICCFIFFYSTMVEWAGGGNVISYMIFGLVGFNFFIEVLSNVLLSPVATRILKIRDMN